MPPSSPRLARELLAIAALILLILLLLGRALLPGRVLMPLDILTQTWPPWQQPNQPASVHNPLISDVVNYIYPVKEFTADAVRQGKLPLWNPYILGGYPATYNTQAGLFYPFSLLFYLLPAVQAADLVIIGQMLLGGASMFAYLRLLAIRRPAALAGSIIFLFNGLMIVWLEWQVIHAAVVWLPLQLYCLEKTARALRHGPAKGIPRQAIWSGVIFAIPWLGGHWNWTLYSSMTAIAYWLWRIGPFWVETHRSGSGLISRQILKISGTLFAIGIGLSLVQVLPAFNYLRQGHRQSLPFGESLNYGLLDRLVVAFVPNFFGNPVDKNWWGPTNYNETTFYLGMLPLFLSALALVVRRDKLTFFFAGWGGLGLLWALGTPAYALLYLLPFFRGLWPSRAIWVFVFCAAVLSAFALDRLLTAGPEGRKAAARMTAAFCLAFTMILAGFLFWHKPDLRYLWPYIGWFILSTALSCALLWGRCQEWLSPSWFAVPAVVWIATDLLIFGYGYNTVSKTTELYPPTEITEFLRSDEELARIVTLPEGVVYPPNSSLALRLANASGYEPSILQRMVDFINQAEGEDAMRGERELMPLKGLESPLIDLWNVKYIVTTRDWWQEISVVDATQLQDNERLSLAPGMVVGQTFAVSDAGLHRLDLHLGADGQATGSVTVRILAEDGKHEFAHADMDVAKINPATASSFYFAAFPSEWGRRFYATVEHEGSGGELFLHAAGNDAYPEGTAMAAGEPLSGDLVFTTFRLPRPTLIFEAGKTKIYLNGGYFDRAFTAGKAILADNAREAMALMTSQIEHLDRVVILELEGQRPPPDLGSEAGTPGRVEINEYGLNHVMMTADMRTDGFVVLADTYYPGWRATVDGKRTPVYRADYMLRSVYLPAGEHEITFSFVPLDFIVGGLAGVVTLVACIILYVRNGG